MPRPAPAPRWSDCTCDGTWCAYEDGDCPLCVSLDNSLPCPRDHDLGLLAGVVPDPGAEPVEPVHAHGLDEPAVNAAATILAVALTTAEATGAETCQRSWQLAVADRMLRSGREAASRA